MYEDLVLALNMCANNDSCERCPRLGNLDCTVDLMNEAIIAIQQLQGSSSHKIDLDADPDEFMKVLGAAECENGTEYIEMFCIGYEDVFAVDIKNKYDLALLRMYFEKHNGKTYGETIKDDYIGKRVIVNFWDGDGCNVIGTREEMESKFKSYLDRLFGSETEVASE